MVSDRLRRWVAEEWLRRVIRNAGLVLLGNGTATVLTMFSLLLGARGLGPAGFGQLSLVVAYVALADGLLNFQSWQALIRYGAEARGNNDRDGLQLLLAYGVRLDLLHAIFAALLASFGGVVAAHLLNWDQDTLILLVASSATLLVRVTGAPTAVLRLFDRFKWVAIHSTIQALFRLLFTAIAFLVQPSVESFVAAWLAADVIGNILLAFIALWVLRVDGLRISNPFSSGAAVNKFPGLRSFVWTTSLHSAMKLGIKEGDVLLVGATAGPVAAGFYRIAKQVSAAAGKSVGPLYQSIYPELANAVIARDVRRFRQMLYRPGLLGGGVFLVVLALFVAVGKFGIELVLGSEFVPAYWPACIYLLGTLLGVGSFSLHPALLALGMPGKSLGVLSVSVVIYLVALVLGSQTAGATGAACAYVVFYFVWTALMVLVVTRESRLLMTRATRVCPIETEDS
jgi:O-antigen/teichoic acid export membrane protein